MTVARSQLVDVSVTRYYHCISRCVRRAFLCGEGFEHRKQWIEDRLETLAGCFAVSVCGFSVMDNHLHLLVRLDGDLVQSWSDEEVVRRWVRVYPPKTLRGEMVEINQAWIDHHMKDAKAVAAMRERLANLGYENVTVRIGDGYKGWPDEAPFDAIIVTAAPPTVPQALVDQLAEGGRMVLPVGIERQELLLLEKKDGKVNRSVVTLVRFVPMVHGD